MQDAVFKTNTTMINLSQTVAYFNVTLVPFTQLDVNHPQRKYFNIYTPCKSYQCMQGNCQVSSVPYNFKAMKFSISKQNIWVLFDISHANKILMKLI